MKRVLKFFGLLFISLLIVYALYSQSDKSNGQPTTPLFNFFQKWFFNSQPSEGLTLYGNVDIRQVDLGFRVGGRVLKMIYEEGNLVSAGALMAVLDKQPYEDQVKQAAAHVESAQASLNNAAVILKRRQQLIGSGGISPQDIDDAFAAREVGLANLKEAEASLGVAQTNLNDTELYAPSDGTLLTRIREPGTVVRQADPIYTLSILSPVWVRTYVSEGQLGLIYPDMPVEVHTDTPGGKIYKGHIGFISPVAEFTPKTVETTQLRTDLVYRLRAIVDNPDRALRQGMPVTVKIDLLRN